MPRTSAIRRHDGRSYPTGLLVATVLLWFWGGATASAQPGLPHLGDMPPGAIGSRELPRGGPLAGYFQPVEIKAPHGVLISPAVGGGFEQEQPAPRGVRLLVGPMYRFKLTNIPGHPGRELFPTLEVIDRTYPPERQALAFPIEVVLIEDDLELALAGRMVTRVIYVEDPQRALPTRERPGEQSWFEARRGEDPYEVAGSLGRPVAIVRVGGRVPGLHGPDPQFLFGSPPLIPFELIERPAALQPDAPEAVRPSPEEIDARRLETQPPAWSQQPLPRRDDATTLR